MDAKFNKIYCLDIMDLKCNLQLIVFVGNPPPVVQWTRTDGPMPHNHIVRDGLLRISRVEAEDSGRYKCQGINRGGISESIAQLTVLGSTSCCVNTEFQVNS